MWGRGNMGDEELTVGMAIWQVGAGAWECVRAEGGISGAGERERYTWR